VFVNVQKHPVVQVLLAKFVCQVVLQRSRYQVQKTIICLSLVLSSTAVTVVQYSWKFPLGWGWQLCWHHVQFRRY